MLFDLCNELVSFQEYINDIFREFLNKFCIAYLNDILIYNNNELKYEIYIKFIFQKLREASLQANIIKCEFYVTQVLYLGLIIIIDKIKINLVKIDTIVN